MIFIVRMGAATSTRYSQSRTKSVQFVKQYNVVSMQITPASSLLTSNNFHRSISEHVIAGGTLLFNLP